MSQEKITLTHEDLYNPEVDARLKQQDARARAAAHYQPPVELQDLVLPARRRGRFWYNPILYMAFFGLVGGLLAWGLGEITESVLLPMDYLGHLREVHQFFKTQRILDRAENDLLRQLRNGQLNEAQFLEAEEKLYRAHADTPLGKFGLDNVELMRHLQRREIDPGQVKQSQDQLQDRLQQAYAKNPLLSIELNRALKDSEKDRLLRDLAAKYEPRFLLADLVYLGQLGLFLACFLALADQVMGRNWRAAVINGSVGVLLGMLGGVLVSLFINQLYRFLLGGGRLEPTEAQQMLARTVAWGVLGLFLAIAPGVVLRNWKRLGIGLAGGLVGGLVGGGFFDPLAKVTDSGWPARLLAITVIGILTGAATGLIEQAAKRGWLYVTAGLIAGKQFILYRNPTIIGSSPRCEIYLFKDLEISPRHAAVHRISGGFELEDLGSTTGTRVNGKPVKRVRLRNGDEVQIGSTGFLFRERGQAARDLAARPVAAVAEPPPPPAPDPLPQGSDMIWEKKRS
jgi:hypothetical protein